MTSDEARTERVALSFLPPGKYRATVWTDGATPNEVRRSQRSVSSMDVLQLPLAAAGGAAVLLEPLDAR
jgi:alpha-glucosidase